MSVWAGECRQALSGPLEQRGLSVDDVDVFLESSYTPLPINSDCFPLASSLLHAQRTTISLHTLTPHTTLTVLCRIGASPGQKMWSGHAWRAHGALAYNVVWERSPQRVPGADPWSAGQGQSLAKLCGHVHPVHPVATPLVSQR